MLGIRKFKGVSIDLWCGAPNEFAVDKLHQGFPEDPRSVFSENHRHISVSVDKYSVSEFVSCIEKLKAALSNLNTSSKSLERVTFIISEIASYSEFQDQLFYFFEEECDEDS